jgi:hypothetical protein
MIDINDATRSKGTIFLKNSSARWALESFNEKMRKPQKNMRTVKQTRVKMVVLETKGGLWRMYPE